MVHVGKEAAQLRQWASRQRLAALKRIIPKRKVTAALRQTGRGRTCCRRTPDALMIWFVVALGLFCDDCYRQIYRWLVPWKKSDVPGRSTLCEGSQTAGGGTPGASGGRGGRTAGHAADARGLLRRDATDDRGRIRGGPARHAPQRSSLRPAGQPAIAGRLSPGPGAGAGGGGHAWVLALADQERQDRRAAHGQAAAQAPATGHAAVCDWTGYLAGRRGIWGDDFRPAGARESAVWG